MTQYKLSLVLTTKDETIKEGVELITKEAEVLDADLLGNYVQVRLKENHAGDMQEAVKSLHNKSFSLKVYAHSADISFSLIDVERAMLIGAALKPPTVELSLSYVATFGPVPQLFLMTQEPTSSTGFSDTRDSKKFN